MNWNIVVIVVSALLLVLVLWRELVRTNRSRLGWRIIASIVAGMSFGCLATEIMVPSSSLVSRATPVLVTEGAAIDSLRSAYPRSPLYTLDRDLARAYAGKLAYIADLNTFPSANGNRSFVVYGFGFSDDELTTLNGTDIIYQSPALPQGITSAYWNRRVQSGENLVVSGKYHNVRSSPVKLVLEGLGTRLDSAAIPPNSTAAFALRNTPSHAGRAVYLVHAMDGKDTLTTEKVPVEVIPHEPLKVMILSAAPGFETKFLKNWLYAQGYAVAVRTTISKNKYGTEYLNMERLPGEMISASSLSGFSLVIADVAELNALSSPSAAALKSQVNNGLGLIMRADSSGKSAFSPFKTYQSADLSKTYPVILPAEKPFILETEHPCFVQRMAGDQPLVTDGKDHTWVNSTLRGRGKLAITTISETFKWELSGNNPVYSSFWSLIVAKTARKDESSAWAVLPVPARIHEPVTVHHRNDDPGYTFWPLKSGWFALQPGASSATWGYIFPAGSWRSVKAAATIKSTTLYAAQSQVRDAKTTETIAKTMIPFPKWIFFTLFLLSCTFLWLETKLL